MQKIKPLSRGLSKLKNLKNTGFYLCENIKDD